jgi:LmbE family N-acetylglucosaminyl deacetylase
MGADISLQYRLGRQVIVVLVTNGNASGVRYLMCKQKQVCLTKEQFTAARNDEMIAAMKKLAPHAIIRYENRQDGELTKAQALAVFKKYLKLYPYASFTTTSWLDEHPDHRALAYAMKDICVGKRRIANENCRFFQSRDYWTSRPVTGSFITGSPSELAAADEYTLWNPSIGRYGIGQQSVPESFASLRKEPRNKYHSATNKQRMQVTK